MSKIINTTIIQPSITFTVTEIEARALDALVGYGDDDFIKVFYEKLGKAYMHKHEAGLRSFFLTVREWMPSTLGQIDNARRAIKGEAK